VYRRSDADLADRLVRQVTGVVSVTSNLAYSFDDRAVPSPSTLYGVPRTRTSPRRA
jgi:hypothetical protein